MSLRVKQRNFLSFSLILILIWNMAIIVSPICADSDIKILNYIAAVLYFLFDPVCHQLPERSLFLSGLPMPVCVRCFFIYLAGLFVFSFPLIWGRLNTWPKKIYLFLALLVVVEIVLEKLGLYHNWIELRALSGFIFGVLIFRLILEGSMVQNIKQRED